MTDHDAVDTLYENDEIMAALGREIIDRILGLRKQGFADENIGTLLLLAGQTYIDEAADMAKDKEDR